MSIGNAMECCCRGKTHISSFCYLNASHAGDSAETSRDCLADHGRCPESQGHGVASQCSNDAKRPPL